MARPSLRVRRRPQRANSQFGRSSTPQRQLHPRGVRLLGVLAGASLTPDRSIPPHARRLRQRRRARPRRHQPRTGFQRKRLRHGLYRQVARQWPRPLQLYPTRAAAGLRVLEGARMHPRLQPFRVLCRRLGRATRVGGLRRLGPNPRRPSVPARSRRQTLLTGPIVGATARPLSHGPGSVPSPIRSSRYRLASQRATRLGRKRAAVARRVLRPLHGLGRLRRHVAPDLAGGRAGARDDLSVLLGPRRHARLAGHGQKAKAL